jgi:hypothetical protein
VVPSSFVSRSSTVPALTDPTPTPPPASEERSTPKMSLRDAMRLVRQRRDPRIEAAQEEAYAQYGDDPDLALTAYAAGAHPLQRACDPAKLAETKRLAAESFSRLPAKIAAE